MEEHSFPRYENDLACFVTDLRSWVYSTQTRAANYFGLSFSTISRYESGELKPQLGYIATLAKLFLERVPLEHDLDIEYLKEFLGELNKVVKMHYPDESLFHNMKDIDEATTPYYITKQKSPDEQAFPLNMDDFETYITVETTGRVPPANKIPELEVGITEECSPIVIVDSAQSWEDKDLEEKVCILVIHDGWMIPARFYNPTNDSEIRNSFRLERDWGAYLVAEQLAKRLGLSGFYYIQIARNLLDYGRFPHAFAQENQIRTSIDPFLNRGAINRPFSEILSEAQKEDLLSNYYDQISVGLESVLASKLITISIHTYDRFNVSGTVRPPVSIITRPKAYQDEQRMPSGAYDPIYPAQLGEFTADRALTYRLALRLETAGIPVALDLPYTFPAGSVEVRTQVWQFIGALKREFEARQNANYYTTSERKVFNLVWRMLQNTNSRSPVTRALREYIHYGSIPPSDLAAEFLRAKEAYELIQEFLKKKYDHIVNNYRYSPSRPSSLAIEIRKDYLWDMKNFPEQPLATKNLRAENIGAVARSLGIGIAEYLHYDHSQKGTPWRNPDD